MRGFAIGLVLSVAVAAGFESTQEPASKSLFQYKEVMIPERDGVHLQTVILTPADQKEPLPILFKRTPYGVPEKAPEKGGPAGGGGIDRSRWSWTTDGAELNHNGVRRKTSGNNREQILL